MQQVQHHEQFEHDSTSFELYSEDVGFGKVMQVYAVSTVARVCMEADG